MLRNGTGDDGMTALMHVSSSGCLEAALLLLSAGADKDCWDRSGRTALMHASERGGFEAASLLLEAGAGKDCRDRKVCI